MSLFKRAFARGVNDELIRHGLARYASKEAADEMADAVGDQMPAEPAAEPVSPETAAEVAATLVDAANKLVEETQGAGLTESPEQQGMMPEEAALKTSASADLPTRAHDQAYLCMVKAAEETKRAEGSTIEGGDKGNSPTGAAAAETQMENKNRPESYANVGVQGVGNTSSGAGRGTGVVGDEQPQPVKPGESPSGSNSVITQSKMGSLAEIIRKVAMAKHAEGSTIEGGDKGNQLAGAPAAETQLEARQRPEGYAEQSRGTTELKIPQGANVGIEQAHPIQPGASPAGSTPPGSANSIVEQSKTSEADPFLVLFKKTAEEVASYLPNNLPDEEKIGHIRHMMGMTGEERTQYVAMIAKEAGATDDQAVGLAAKHAEAHNRRRYDGNSGRQDRTSTNQKTAELPPALQAAIDKKKDGEGEKKENPFAALDKKDDGHEKKETPAEEKKEEEAKKEGSDLISRIRNISRSVRG
jgi:hypothetical protein